MPINEPEIKQVAPATPVATSPQSTGLSKNEIMRVALLVAFVAGAFILFRLFKMTEMGRRLTDKDAGRAATYVQEWLRQWGGWGWLIYSIAGTILMSIGFPRLAFAAISGALYGVILGTLLTQVANTLSAIPGFYYTRFMGREITERKMRGRLQRLNGLLRHHGFKVMLLVRLCPVGNSFITSCLFGVSAISFLAYVTASGIGFLPGNFILALLGGSVSGNFHVKLWTSMLLFVIYSLFFTWYFKRSPLAKDIMAIMKDKE